MKDNFSKQAVVYAKYRPAYPPQLYDFIVDHTTMKRAAWDCGTGNGQSARELARYFEKVLATDISQQQIAEALQVSNIFYSVQPAENTSFEDNSFDLVTVAQALHWFSLDEFYKELNRVAKPGAIFAAWTYSLLRIAPGIDELIADYHFNILKDYWDAERRYVDEEYETIPFPFLKMNTPRLSISYEWSLEDLEGYLNTWSALQKYMAVNQHNPVDELMTRLKVFWKSERRDIIFPIHLLMGRIEK